jgi:hypothetical protein
VNVRARRKQKQEIEESCMARIGRSDDVGWDGWHVGTVWGLVGNPKERHHFEDIGVGRRIILKLF